MTKKLVQYLCEATTVLPTLDSVHLFSRVHLSCLPEIFSLFIISIHHQTRVSGPEGSENNPDSCSVDTLSLPSALEREDAKKKGLLKLSRHSVFNSEKILEP